ncbi:hypothetical protein E2C01_022506 [Portunus trituberculatus]|uniref:Uncharacterized protein n=1 Tax=Portunus trituberculatus TaxID=210409 RepID=A0A5B7E5J6_PORTR|nr:hypothetical protein [Portunus trituberculatus]
MQEPIPACGISVFFTALSSSTYPTPFPSAHWQRLHDFWSSARPEPWSGRTSTPSAASLATKFSMKGGMGGGGILRIMSGGGPSSYRESHSILPPHELFTDCSHKNNSGTTEDIIPMAEC